MTDDGCRKAKIGKRVKRYAKIASSAVRVGKGIAAQRIVGGKNDALEAALIRSALGNLKGPLMKIGQLLAGVPDLMPPAYAAELATLQSHAPPMAWSNVSAQLKTALGRGWNDIFASFEKDARFAASLGQVHFARAKDGTALACKVQYPEMEDVVRADLRQLKIVFSLFKRFSGTAIDTDEAFKEIEERLLEELDYVREARAMTLFKALLEEHSFAHIPKYFPEFSGANVLCMEWRAGAPFDEAVFSRAQGDRNAIAENLFRLWYLPFYRAGVLHGDPHPGNYTIMDDGSVNLLDFGCTRAFSLETVRAVVLLFEALSEGDDEKLVHAYRLWGFKKPTKALISALNVWARFVYAPFLEDRIRVLEETNATEKGRQAAKEVYAELKKTGIAVTIPRAFVLIDRASVGLGGAFLRLRPRVNWHKLLWEILDGFDVAALEKRARAAQQILDGKDSRHA